MLTALEYFCGEELPATVWTEKYAVRNKQGKVLEKNPDEMHWRIASEFARIEKKKFKKPWSVEEIYELLKDFNYLIPQGSPMAGIGAESFVSLSNCFVVEPPLDSYGGILKTDQQLVQLCKRRGGVGTDISHIRPDNLPTTNSSRTATGILPFMERFSNSIREVGQNGRRGALMLTISVHHPQVLEFARVKLDPNKVTGANISIRLSKAFMQAVESDSYYEQKWPVDSDSPAISKQVKAREVWKEIVKCAHARAEPGLLFWDHITEESPADCYEDFQTVSTNPCMPKWALLLTPSGLKPLGDLDVGDRVWSETGWLIIKGKWSSGVKPVYRYRTTAGVVYSTTNHRIIQQGDKVAISEAETIDILRGPFYEEYASLGLEVPIPWDSQAVMDGVYFGDGAGTYSHNKVLYIGEKDTCYFDSEIAPYIKEKFDGFGSDFAWKIESTLSSKDLGLTHKKRIPAKYMMADRYRTASFLRGLYSANGSVVGDRITLKTASPGLAEDVQVLLSSLGITSYYTTNKQHDVQFSNGVYNCKESYDVNISRDRGKFSALIGFIHPYKQDKLKAAVEKVRGKSTKPLTHDIISAELVSEEEVFDLEVDGLLHTYWHGNHNIANCGEIPLSILDSCRLLVVNLFSCVKNPFTKNAEFDFDLLYDLAMKAQRLMDDLVDLEIECVGRIINKISQDKEPKDVKEEELNTWIKIEEAARKGRRTGLGPTAIGDALAALGVPYGSKKSIKLVEDFYKTIKYGAYQSSVNMAKELGSFPVWNPDKEKNNPFLLRIKKEVPSLWKEMQKYGRRNIALLTTAPVGSVSLLAGPRKYCGTTSGIEPLFKDEPYTRRKKINHSEKNSKVDFIDDRGDKWTEFTIYHPKIKMWMDITGETDWKKSPYHGNCAEDLDWKARVELQAAAQKHVDHSISSTINLPEDVTVEKVEEIYETAWKAGCKGITVYRKGCRDGVLVDKKKGLLKTTAPKRPAELSCDVHHTTTKGTPCTVFVGNMEGDPYEVFAVLGELEIDKNCSNGVMIKKKRGDYKFRNLETEVDITDQLTDEQAAVTRLVSTALRHGTEIHFIVHQLEKVRGDLNGFAKALARVLKKYIKDGTAVSGEKCTKCDSDSLVRQEGCLTCKNCGNSKCG